MSAILPPCPAPFNMAEYVLAAGHDRPDHPALQVIDGSVWSNADIRRAVTGLAGGLRSLGLGDGATVLIRLGNRVEFPILYLACIWAGLVPVPTSAQLTRSEITKIADQLLPDLIVAGAGIACPQSACRVIDLDTLAQLQRHAPVPPVMGDPDRLGYIIFTSGTSGTPRGVCHAHRAIWARRMMFDGWYGLRPDDRVLHAGAFNWSYTMGTGLMDPWTVGATAIIPPDGMGPDALAAAVATSQATIFAAAPGIYRQVLKSTSLTPSPILRHGLSAGEALAPSLRAAWKDKMGCDIHEALGMSECSTFVSGSPDHPAPEGKVGRAQTGRRIAVLDEGSEPIVGSPGVLAVDRRDPGLMLGYLNDPPIRDEWFKTGDMVQLSTEGWITYLGRTDDVMTAGGFRVSPLEVEDAFASLAGLDDCAAAHVPLGPETTVIALFYAAKAALDDTVLRAHAGQMLARYKQPRLYIHRATLPKGANGKLNRLSLRTSYKAGS